MKGWPGSRVGDAAGSEREELEARCAYGDAKYPLMSIIRSVGLEASTVIPPMVACRDDGRIGDHAAVNRIQHQGSRYPLPRRPGQRGNPTAPDGTTVKFNEYAWAVDGMEHPEERIGNVRSAYAARLGGPNAPVKLWVVRVSAMRHGASG